MADNTTIEEQGVDSVLFLVYSKDDPTDALIFPVTPPSVKMPLDMQTRSIETAEIGTVIIPVTRQPMSIQWESFLPGTAIQDHEVVVAWTAPDDIVAQIKRWMEQAITLQLLITGTPISMEGFIASCPFTMKDGNGSYGYSLTFVEGKEIEIPFIANEHATGTASTSIPATGGTGKTTTAINVRSGPGYTYEVIDRLDANTTVKVIDANDIWRKVSYGNPARTGWVEGTYLQTASGSGGSGTGAGGTHYKLPRWYKTTGRERGVATIARKFYGSAKAAYCSLIASYNTKDPAHAALYPGAGKKSAKGVKVWIPKKTSPPVAPAQPYQGVNVNPG